MNSTGLTLMAVVGLLFASTVDAQFAGSGAQDYKLCAGCHGFKGEGNALVNAPALGGQETWYLERQIRNFRQGIRGGAGDDAAGHTMSQMTKGLDGDEDIRKLAAYIGTLPAADPNPTLQGDTERGRSTYATCAACHGVSAEGNVSLNAPALARIDDWYQLAQLQKFKAGSRGGLAEDIYGQQMAPMAAVLVDDQAMKDVVAYISTLR